MITCSIIFPFTEFNSSRPGLVVAVCQDLKKINSAETIRGNTVYHAKSQLNTPVWGSLHSPNYYFIKVRSGCTHAVSKLLMSELNSQHLIYSHPLSSVIMEPIHFVFIFLMYHIKSLGFVSAGSGAIKAHCSTNPLLLLYRTVLSS